MFIDFNQIARLGKLVALLGFFLPWVTVSCSNTEIMQATGWQLMVGDPQPAGPLEGMQSERQQVEDSEPAVVIILAFAIILIGLIASAFTRTRVAAMTMLATSVLGIGVSYYGVSNLSTELQREITDSQGEQGASFISADQQRQMSEAVASSITVEEQEGYMVTHGGLVLAILFALLTLFSRRKSEETPAVAPPS